ncbi:hypothetical protein [Pedobacter ureilyticus]|uniref:Uncharacterized protein n=1 Tax=Pedobacter ureilyticus TaxID=1393051 RepID=A0ABW9J7R0_9SPHI|nr:hypothetical protein [Pedobacter helvus]
METMTTEKTNVARRLAITVGVVGSLLLIPLIAMQFTNEVKWNLGDFVIMGTLLLITGLGIEIVTRKVKSAKWKFVVCAIILFILFLAWAELAVGVFGGPFAGS